MDINNKNIKNQFLKNCEDLRNDIDELNDLLREAGLKIKWEEVLKPLYHGRTIH
jgi:hypothetical protein